MDASEPLRRAACVPMLALMLIFGSPAAAQDSEAAHTPAALQELEACRALPDAEAKAQCYDAAVDRMLAALDSGELVAVERSEIERAQREGAGLPSFEIPGLGGLAASSDDKAPITVHILSLERSALGAISFETDGGQRWVQVGADRAPRMPDAPLDAELTPAFGDTWFVRIPGRTPIRVKREQ